MQKMINITRKMVDMIQELQGYMKIVTITPPLKNQCPH